MAIWTGAHPGNFRTGRRGYRPEAVVIHIMDGSLIGTDSWFNDPKSSVSAHYGIGRKGEVHQYVKEIDSAFHAGTVDRPEWKLIKRKREGGGFINPNFYTIGI
jgi:N-acetylmuramoyl-L-alanine amidase